MLNDNNEKAINNQLIFNKQNEYHDNLSNEQFHGFVCSKCKSVNHEHNKNTASATVESLLMDKPKILVLGAGGIKGLLELGSLLYLESKNILSEVNTFINSSIGSIICLLLVIGYSVCDILDDITRKNIIDSVTDGFFSSINEMRKRGGLIDIKTIKDWLSDRVKSKLGYIPSLGTLYKITGSIFCSVSLNITKRKLVYFNKETYPNLSCIDAALSSICIPFLFGKIKLGGDIYIDGGLVDPYPIHYYDNGNDSILGLYIIYDDKRVLEKDVEDNLEYLSSIAHCHAHVLSEESINRSSSKCVHIKLTSPFQDTIGLSLSNKDKARLIDLGWKTCLDYLEKKIGQAEQVLQEISQPINKDIISNKILIPITDKNKQMIQNKKIDHKKIINIF